MNYEYFGLKPKSQSGMFRINNTLMNYVPGSINTLEVSPCFNESNDLPFNGNIGNSRQIDPVDTTYNDPRLLGVVGNSPEELLYYQRALPNYIKEHYSPFSIPLTVSQNQYMTDKSTAYVDLYQPNETVRMPLT